MTTANTARLLITCEDKPGIVQAVSSFLYHQGANITALDQSNFSISIENMKDAHTVKVLRWAMPSLRPLHNAVEVSVKK